MRVEDIVAWPEHHASAAWWIAAVLSTPWWAGRFWKLLRKLPIWGKNFTRNQRATRIRALERLHNNTNLLILYVLRDAFSIGIEFSVITLMIAFLSRSTTMPPRQMVYIFGLLLGSTLIGDVIRLRTVVVDLMDYDAKIASLKAKQN